MTGKDIIDNVSVIAKVDPKTVQRVMQAYIQNVKDKIPYNQISIKDFGTFALRELPNGNKKPTFCPAKNWIEKYK